MIISGTPEFGAGFTADLAGIYTITGNRLWFSQTADAFVRDIDWTIDGSGLRASGDLGGAVTGTVTLTKG